MDTLRIKDVIFDPSYISDIPDKETVTAVKQRSHQLQLRSAKVPGDLSQ